MNKLRFFVVIKNIKMGAHKSEKEKVDQTHLQNFWAHQASLFVNKACECELSTYER